MDENPSAIIITDVKENNIRALEKIHDTLPDAHKRVIPQIYTPEEFEKVKKMGFKQIIWTLYRYQGDDDDILEKTKQFYGSIAIAMPVYKAITKLPTRLQERMVPTYVHTVNEEEEMEKFMNLGITEIYTDFLAP